MFLCLKKTTFSRSVVARCYLAKQASFSGSRVAEVSSLCISSVCLITLDCSRVLCLESHSRFFGGSCVGEQRFSSLLLPHSRRPVGRLGPRAKAWSAKFCPRSPLALLVACPYPAWAAVSTNRTELPGLSVAANPFIKRASIPTSVSAPQVPAAIAF